MSATVGPIACSEAARRAHAGKAEPRHAFDEIVSEVHLLRRENAALRDREAELVNEIVALRARLAMV